MEGLRCVERRLVKSGSVPIPARLVAIVPVARAD